MRKLKLNLKLKPRPGPGLKLRPGPGAWLFCDFLKFLTVPGYFVRSNSIVNFVELYPWFQGLLERWPGA